MGNRGRRAVRYAPKALRFLMALLIFSVSLLVALHHWIPDILTWLPVEVQIAVAIALFGVLVQRIMRVYEKVTIIPFTIHPTHRDAFNSLLTLARRFGASNMDLLQFSGASVLELIQALLSIQPGKKLRIRLFLVDDQQARKYDSDWGCDWHVHRIQNTISKLRELAKDHQELTYEVFRYSTNAEISVVVIDDFYASIGWYHSYMDEKKNHHLRGHDTPAINVILPEGRALLEFIRAQVESVRLASTKMAIPSAP